MNFDFLNKSRSFISFSKHDTYALSKDFSKCITLGTNIFLVGDLGAGKTSFTKGILDCLGVREAVNSPSFKLMNEYNIFLESQKIKFYHIDLYRLNDVNEILDLGIYEIIMSKNISVIEWADRAFFLWSDKKFNNSYRIDIDYEFDKIDFDKMNIKKLDFQKRVITIRDLKF